MDLRNHLPHSIFHQTHWRMLRAQSRRLEEASPNPKLDDEWVEIALLIQKSGNYPKTLQSARKSFEIWASRQQLRWLLEAQLLTDRSFQKIGKILSLPESVVHAYHQLFFDVRGKMQARDWIMSRVVRYHPMGGFDGPEPDSVWKHFAFVGGPLILDLVVAVTLERPLPEFVLRRREKGTANSVRDEFLRRRVKLLISLLAERDFYQLGSHWKQYERLRALEVNAGIKVSPQTLPPSMIQFLDLLSKQAPAQSKAAKRAPVEEMPAAQSQAKPKRVVAAGPRRKRA